MYRSFQDDSRGCTMKPPDKPVHRTTNDPHIFPPIEGLHGRELTRVIPETQGRELTRVNPETHESQVEVESGRKPTRFSLPPRYVLYRKWGLVANGGRGVYTLVEDKPELNKSLTMDVISPPRRKVVRSPVKNVPRPPDMTKRASFTITGKEIQGGRAIRKKIEEFRHWHEEQYRLKIDTAKAKVTTQEPTPRSKAHDAFTLAILKKDKTPGAVQTPNTYNKQDAGIQKVSETPRHPVEQLPTIVTSKNQLRNGQPDNPPREKQSRDSSPPLRPESPPAPVPEALKARVQSSKTWRTWRDVNESYAYSDVKSYIKDNELMEGDKEKHIRSWVRAVEKARVGGQCIGTDGDKIQTSHTNSDSTCTLGSESSS